MKLFRWNDWNLENATKHGCTPAEIESAVRRPVPGWPRKWGNGKWKIEGRGRGDRMIEVLYVLDWDETIYVIHAMPLTTRRRKGNR